MPVKFTLQPQIVPNKNTALCTNEFYQLQTATTKQAGGNVCGEYTEWFWGSLLRAKPLPCCHMQCHRHVWCSDTAPSPAAFCTSAQRPWLWINCKLRSWNTLQYTESAAFLSANPHWQQPQNRWISKGTVFQWQFICAQIIPKSKQFVICIFICTISLVQPKPIELSWNYYGIFSS